MKKILKKYWYYLLFVIFFATSVLTTGILAKYTYQDDGGEITGTSSPMYFTIDLIQNVYGDEDITELKYSSYGGAEKTLTFSVQNFYDELRYTGYDVTYTTKVENTSADVANQSFNDYTLTQEGNPLAASYVLTGNGQDSDKFTLVVSDTYETGTELTITVTANSPFKKELKLVFEFNNTSNTVNYYVLDSVDSLYAELIIYTDIKVDKNKILIDWEAINAAANTLQIDSTSPYIDILDTTGQVKEVGADYYFTKKYVAVDLEENMSISIHFFKANPSDKISYQANTTSVYADGSGIYTIKLEQAS